MENPSRYPLAGTWDVINRHGEPRYVVEHDGNGGWWGVCQPDRPEDCYVLAASKDLLAVLKRYVEEDETNMGDPLNARFITTKNMGLAAIEKAEGY